MKQSNHTKPIDWNKWRQGWTGSKAVGPNQVKGPCPVTGEGKDTAFVKVNDELAGCGKCSEDGSGRLTGPQLVEHAKAAGCYRERPPKPPKPPTPRCRKEEWIWHAPDGSIRVKYRRRDGTKRWRPVKPHNTPPPSMLMFLPPDGKPPDGSQAVFVCEGETDTLAVASLGVQAIGRGNAKPDPESLARLPKNPTYIVWPDVDDDASGYRQAAAWARDAAAAGLTVKAIDPLKLNPDAKDGFDARDFVRTAGDKGGAAVKIAGAVVKVSVIEKRAEPPEQDKPPPADIPEIEPIDPPFPRWAYPEPPAVSIRSVSDLLDFSIPDGELSYVKEQGEWRCWTGQRWLTDQGFNFERHCSMSAQRCWRKVNKDGIPYPDPRSAGSTLTAAGVRDNMRTYARRVSRTDEWDADRAVLGLPGGGCVEIRNGVAERRAQTPADRITINLPVDPADDWRGSQFHDFLERVAPDQDTADYLQRMFGYAAICDGSETVWLWMRGATQSGKSTLVLYAAGALGLQGGDLSYAQPLANDALLVHRAHGHPSREAKLAYARLAFWSEAKDGGVVDSERIKTWTGGDPQQSQFMRKDPFTWIPRFLLVTVSNSDLVLAAPDPALYARVRLVSGFETIPEEDQAKGLRGAARRGDPHAAAWIIEGARLWTAQRADGDGTGLLPETDMMRADRIEWQESADPVTLFIKERYRVDDVDGKTKAADLYAAYTDWCNENRHKPAANRTFKKRVRAVIDRDPKYVRLFEGVKMCWPLAARPEPEAEDPDPTRPTGTDADVESLSIEDQRRLDPDWRG